MFLEFFKLWDEPFGVTPDPAYLYPSHTHLHALDSVRNGILSGRGFMTLIAEPGMGKTTLLYQLIEQMPQTTRTAYLFQTQCNSLEFMQYLLTEVGVDPTGMGLVAMHRRLNEMLFDEMVQGRQFVLIVDESQNLSNAVLETIRLLSNFETAHSKLLQIVLAGQSELANKLKQPELSQLLQRINVMASLNVLTFEETAAYIRHRLKLAGHNGEDLFDPAAFAAVYRRSRGIPRNINRVCHAALEQTATEQAQIVTAAIVEKSNRGLGATVEDLQRSRFASQPRQVAPLNIPDQVEQQARTSPSAPRVPPAQTHPEPLRTEEPRAAEEVAAPAPPPPPPLTQNPQPSPVELPHFTEPFADFVPQQPQGRSYRWLAWATVFITLLVLAFLAAPANLREALLQRIQSVAGSTAPINDSRPSGNSNSKSSVPDVRRATPAVDSARNATKNNAATTKVLKIVIDPGHGGADAGVRGPNGLLEKNVCLEVALRLGQLIEDGLPGTEVIYTRSDDQNISPQRRGAAANDASANLFISIHADSLSDGQRLQVYYLGAAPAKKSRRAVRESGTSDVSLKLAGNIQDALVQGFALRAETGPIAAPAQPAFSVLSNTQVPAVIAEISFTEGGPLVDPDQRQKLAESLYRGIAGFLKEHPERSSAASTN